MTRARADSELPRAHRRVTTVLIADLVGYAGLAERIDPEDLDRIMRRLIEGERRIVTERFGGTIFGSDGDDVKALFGDPVAHEDDARRAVRCAKELQEFAERVGREFPELGAHPLLLHTAISTGMIVSKGSSGSGFGPTGDAINIAARLVHVAKAGEIVIEANTHRDVAEEFEVERIGSVSLRGKSENVEVYRVLGEIPHAWFEVARERGLSPFVGRARALAALSESLGSTHEGRGGLVVVRGEPGVGKSRLLYEFRQSLGDEVRVVLAECETAPTVALFQPFLVILRSLLGIGQTESSRGQRERITAVAPELDRQLEGYVVVFLQLLSLRDKDEPLPPHLHDERLGRAILEAFALLVAAVARRLPLVLLLEDWHLADDGSRSVLDRLLEEVPRQRLLVIVTYRSEWKEQWGVGTAPRKIHLQPLSLADARAVVRSCLGSESVPDQIVEALHQRTGGNPLFLDEFCRSLREIGFRPDARDALAKLTAPATVQAVIRARIDRLDVELRRLLRLASVLGLSFPLDLLSQLAKDEKGAVAEMLAALADLDLLSEDAGDASGHRRYRFKHAITREVAYETLLLEDRRALHLRTGAAIESIYSDSLEEHCEVLASHFQLGGDDRRAARFAIRAGDKAVATFSLGAARTWYRRAISLLDRFCDTTDAVRERIDVSGKWAEACVYDPSAIDSKVLERSYELAQLDGDRRRAARAVYWMGWFDHARGNHHAAACHFERAFELADASKYGRLVPQLQTNLGQNAYHRGEFNLAAQRLRRAFSSNKRTTIVANALGYMALVDAERGHFASARERLTTALDIVRELEQLQLEGSILTIATYVELFQGCWQACIDRAAEMRTIAAAIDAPYILAMSKTADGYARWFLSGSRDSLVPMCEAVAEIEAGDSKLSMSTNYACLAEVMALSGDLADAQQFARKARSRAEAGDRIGEIQACRALGIAETRGTSPHLESARLQFEQAIALAVARSARREAVVTRWRLAEALAAAGDTLQARKLASGIVRAFENLDMSWHAARAQELRRRLS